MVSMLFWDLITDSQLRLLCQNTILPTICTVALVSYFIDVTQLVELRCRYRADYVNRVLAPEGELLKPEKSLRKSNPNIRENAPSQQKRVD